MVKKTSVSAARLDTAAATLLAGKQLLPNDHNDRQDLARIASQLKIERFLPVQRRELADGTIAYFMSEADRREYYEDRDTQLFRQRAATEAAKDQRDARIAMKIFARKGWVLPYELTVLAAMSDAEMGKLFGAHPSSTTAPVNPKKKNSA